MRDLVVLIPCRNDYKPLEKIILDIGDKYNLLIIDDFSSDNIGALKQKYQIEFIRNKKNLGYEKSLIKGFNLILKRKHVKFIITLDADGQHSTKDIKKFYKKIKFDNTDLVVGNRKNKNRSIEYKLSKISKKKYNIYDPICGFKAYRKSLLKKLLKSTKSNFFLGDIIPLAFNNSFKMINLNINTNARRYGRPKVGSKSRVVKKINKIINYFCKSKVVNDIRIKNNSLI